MMSGPNGDPSMSTDDGIINDEDEFDNEGKVYLIVSLLIISHCS